MSGTDCVIQRESSRHRARALSLLSLVAVIGFVIVQVVAQLPLLEQSAAAQAQRLEQAALPRQPLISRIRRAVANPSGKTHRIALEFRSNVEATGSGFRYFYSFANTGETTAVRIEWVALNTSEFGVDAVHRTAAAFPTVNFDYAATSPRSPTISYHPARIFVRDGFDRETLVASGMAAAYVPMARNAASSPNAR